MAMTTMPSTSTLDSATISTHPGAFGLFSLATAAIHLSLYQAGFIGFSGLGIGLFLGAMGMLGAGIAELRRQNAYAAVLFCALGLFCLSLLALIVLPGFGYGSIPAQPTLTAYLGIWGFFCLILASGARRESRSLQAAIELMALFLFFMAAASAGGFASISAFAAMIGIVCGAAAILAGTLQSSRKRRNH